AIVLDPARMPLNHRSRAQIVAYKKDKECCWQYRAPDQPSDMAPHPAIAAQEQEREDGAEREKCVHMKERHRGIERELNPQWEVAVAAPKAFGADGGGRVFELPRAPA